MLLDNSMYKESNDEWIKYKWAIFKDQKDIWSVPNPFLEILFTYKKEIPNLEIIEIFIETGTHNGITADTMAKHFKQVYTIENDPNRTIDPRIGLNSNIIFCLGDSPKELEKIGPIIGNARCIFLLDAHNSYESPLSEELKVIKQHFNKQSVIMIDDTCDLGIGTWPTKEKLEALIYAVNSDYKINYTKMGRDTCLVY